MSERLYLIGRIAGRAVAFCADDVESVVDLDAVTPVPCAPIGVDGLAALRSTIVTVVDPCVALTGQPRVDAGSRAVVARVEGHGYALRVEAVEDVAAFAAQPLPAGLTVGGRWAGVAVALIEREGEPLPVIALERLIPTGGALLAAA